MSRCVCDVSNMTLDELRAAGVASVEFGAALTRVTFFEKSIAPAATAAPSPSTPEHSGKSDPSEDEKPKKDIFDVLSEGLIPGAPSRDGLAGTPSPG